MADKESKVRRSPLHERHEALGARFEEWKWGRKDTQLVPMDYGDTYGEHAAVRERAGVFDLSHQGQIMLHGLGTGKALNAILTNDIDQLNSVGKSQYSLLCDRDGGVIDEILVNRFTKSGFELFGTAANWLDAAILIDDYTPGLVELAVLDGSQVLLEVHGPESARMLGRLGIPVGHPHMDFEIATLEPWEGAWACRTDRLGEESYLVVMLPEPGLKLWDALLASGASACGLDAYDLLRLEQGLPKHGSELGPDVNPVEARMGWAVGWSKEAFHGKESLESIRTAGPARRLWGLEALDDGVPLSGAAVFEGDRRVGVTTSAGYSPTVDKGIALALLDSGLEPGTRLEAEGPEGRVPVRVVKPPFTP
jgi:aminomethyltransferase